MTTTRAVTGLIVRPTPEVPPATQPGVLTNLAARDANLDLFAAADVRPSLTGADLIEVVEQDSAVVGLRRPEQDLDQRPLRRDQLEATRRLVGWQAWVDWSWPRWYGSCARN